MATLSIPVSIQTKVFRQEGTSIYYPQLIGLPNNGVQQSINQTIIQLVQSLAQEQYKQQSTNAFIEMIGSFEIKTNERNILSVSITNYAYAYKHAHGLTLMKSLTFDTLTGKVYRLADLFKPESNYVPVLSDIVQKQIDDRDIQIIGDFSGISRDQDFYIADKTLVLYFQLYEITPYYVGFPMFPISIYTLQDIITENGPLGRMLGN